ncbi:MAG: Uma2 family endonuclease [Syntrophobacteraceae bacterium]|nr:Uma2 family endonuclease [Syntrophobacteraceae bacterium]
MSTQAAKEAYCYTYEDYLEFPDDLRCEIINGQIYDMTPSPTTGHQGVTGEIYGLIWDHPRNQKHGCQVFVAPLDVVISQDQVVQPDVLIVCDRKKIERTHIAGAPDVVFETASPATSLKDRREKMELYERYGVAEYFIIDPDARFLEKFASIDGKYGRVGIYAGDATFCIDTISLEICAKELFSE